jgi:hypothetical protein
MMKLQIPTAKHGMAIVATILISPIAFGEGVGAKATEVVRVTAPRPSTEVADAKLETNAAALLEAIARRLEQERENRLEAIAPARIELAMADIPSRG